LVGADGAASTVRRATDSHLRLQPTPALVEYPRAQNPDGETLTLRFFPNISGYLWDFPRRDHRSVGIEAQAKGSGRARLDALLDEYLGRADVPGAAGPRVRVGAVIGSRPPGRRRFAGIAGEGYALLGDAAGLADPFTGEGIRNAVRSAELLASAFSSGSTDWTRAYARMARRKFAPELAGAARARTLLSDSGLGVRVLRSAATSPDAHALVAALLDALAEHEYGLASLRARWVSRRRLARPGGVEVALARARQGN
jgi:flavin-dependent dehydrogenase